MVRSMSTPWISFRTDTQYGHEKLYEEIQDKVIRSDDLPDSVSRVSKTFRGITVVLCTLSMLSNPNLADCGLFNILPVNSLVIDEASQIDVFEFMVISVLALLAIYDTLNQHLFYNHSKKLNKVCFFGDPKQRESYSVLTYMSPISSSYPSSALRLRRSRTRNNFRRQASEEESIFS